MRVGTGRARSLAAQRRMDAKYFLSPGYVAAEKLALAKAAGLGTEMLGGKSGLAKVWAPSRFKRVYATPSEPSIPYLRPYDIFDYLPEPADWISRDRTKNLESYLVKKGMILQTCSGRNLGPGVLVDSFLERFMMSHDLVRIEVEDSELRHYLLGFLGSSIGQELLKRDKSGSVIDHISVDHVAAQEIPMLDKEMRVSIASRMERVVSLRESARWALNDALRAYQDQLPQPGRGGALSEGWTIKASALSGRLDAASYDPLVTRVRDELLAIGGARVGDVAKVLKPAGRYKTVYVEENHGRPILSGSQVLQSRPINLRFMAERALSDPRKYGLKKGWTVYQADGRSEEGLGIPVMVTSDREGWLASGHVGRLVPHRQSDAGWIYLAARSWQTQLQIKALASGSVVDSTFPFDMQAVVLPPPLDVDSKAISRTWEKFARAEELERTVTNEFDGFLANMGGAA